MSRVLLLVLLAALALLPAAARAATSDVVVSQIYGGGGNAGATFRNDYVELFNAGSASVDVSGWTVQYATAAGTSWQTTALSGTIAAGRYYLVQLASNADVGAVLPAPNATGTSNLAGTSGKIALVRGTAALTCGASAGSCSTDPLVADLVGYGDASDFEGADRPTRFPTPWQRFARTAAAPTPETTRRTSQQTRPSPGTLPRRRTRAGQRAAPVAQSALRSMSPPLSQFRSTIPR